MLDPLRVIVEASLESYQANRFVRGGCSSIGVTEELAELAADTPLAFVAVTVNVYAVPFVKPVTVIGLDEPV